GSWSPAGDPFGGGAGRIMTTSLALLTLQSYYRTDLLLAGGPARQLDAKGVEAAWNDLAAEDVFRARRSAWALIKDPRQSVPFRGKHLQPAPASADTKNLARWVADLNSDRFPVRDQASKEIEKLGKAAEPALKKALAGNPPLEARRRI